MNGKRVREAFSLDDVDRRIINGLQGGFPICARPFARAAETLGIGEQELIVRIGRLKEWGIASRFGPLYNAEAMGGGVTLAAMAVPEPRIAEIARLLNETPEVAHNYLRDFDLNMWFVVLTERAEDLEGVLARLEAAAGLPIYPFPKERSYFLELKLEA